MSVVGAHGYIEDFVPGSRVEHRRGHTVCEADNQMMSLLTMNTAQTHYNADSLASYMGGAFDRPLLNACVALAIGVGLTSQDMSENLLADLGYDRFTMPAPVFVGDTLYARSTVVGVDPAPDRSDAGVLTYDIEVRNLAGDLVLAVERRVLLKSRAAWSRRDESTGTVPFDAAVARLHGS